MKFRTERLLLTSISLDYLNEIHALHSLPETDKFNTPGIPASVETTKEIVLDWLAKEEAPVRNAYIFCVKLIANNDFIGLIALNVGKPTYSIAEVWYKTHPDYWGKGYTSEALHEILNFGFNKLQLHRIEAGCAVENIASIKVLEKAGMIREGRKRKILPIRGQWVDNYFYSILDNEWK